MGVTGVRGDTGWGCHTGGGVTGGDTGCGVSPPTTFSPSCGPPPRHCTWPRCPVLGGPGIISVLPPPKGGLTGLRGMTGVLGGGYLGRLLPPFPGTQETGCPPPWDPTALGPPLRGTQASGTPPTPWDPSIRTPHPRTQVSGTPPPHDPGMWDPPPKDPGTWAPPVSGAPPPPRHPTLTSPLSQVVAPGPAEPPSPRPTMVTSLHPTGPPRRLPPRPPRA